MIEITHIESLIEKHDTPVTANSKGDKRNIFVLLVLYTLQGVPLGLSLAIPIIIQNMHRSSFKEQAKFSLAVWPFSLKLLWAPLVDSLFIRKLGRRKSWLIPVQYFLATQDIIVDGWALTMLKRRNISYASMCNGAGQAFGIFLGYILPILLLSESFWNKWWRTTSIPGGVITLQGYFYFWGIIYIVITTLVAIFKHEKDYLSELDAVDLSIAKTYMLLFSIMKLPSIKMFAIILLTIKMSFCSVDAAFKLKLIDSGITKDEIAAIDLLFIPLNISLPFFITTFTSKEKPLKNYFNTIPYRLLFGVVLATIVYFTPYFLDRTGSLLITYKVFLVLMYSLQQLTVSIMTLTAMTFYASISDPKIGGTNMTLLTTISNLGNVWSKTGALWLIEFLTLKRCSNDPRKLCSTSNNQKEICSLSGGTCEVYIDGFYIETIICTIYGIIWFFIFRKIINNLQSKHVKEWHVEIKIK
ncbi:acetyl-coenzyme A transporter 1 isoform X2 [Acyrthosiphon pisum]|uniref:Acetyl-coenzyme A transporter 1 n=1 Tax=Acyrthosiphon pisum TaxID=7029 RepID=A0A8R2JPD7_ACYPI|nr:acetyl-coenzyme A transporter 1 isoform X2 [Acyrthosiphon pisum]|eukprot:XP_016660082.1 PREDICTED: acetyl-coenzyme A transporter 1 isoform X2 [Acyrthosiphon pisum]